MGFARRAGATRVVHLYQRNPLRVLFPVPEPHETALAVLVTTSGGLVAGDRLTIIARAETGAAAHVTASAAEKVYRSTGATVAIVQRLTVESGGWLEYLPPETILFDGARLRRQTQLDLAPGAGFLGGGIVVFGRRARGESFTRGLLHDGWEVWRDGNLVWGEALHLDGDVAALMADPACFAGAAACAMLLMAPPQQDSNGFLETARQVQYRAGAIETRRFPASVLQGDVTVVNGLLVARWLGDPLPLRRSFAELACHLRQAAMGLPPRLPRLWHV